MPVKWSDFFLPILFFTTEAQESSVSWSDFFLSKFFSSQQELNHLLQFGLISFYQNDFMHRKTWEKLVKWLDLFPSECIFNKECSMNSFYSWQKLKNILQNGLIFFCRNVFLCYKSWMNCCKTVNFFLPEYLSSL